MRKIISNTFVTLDGVLQAPGGPEEDRSGGFKFGGWVSSHWDEMLGRTMDEFMSGHFDLLLGRKTYEIFAAYWPYVENDIAHKFNAVKKYVVSATINKLNWKNSLLIRGNAASEIKKLKEQDGPDLHVYGSGKLIKTLANSNLIDQFKILTFPVVVGKGKQLFGEGTDAGSLKLVDLKSSGTGVIIAVYEPAGELRMGLAGPESINEEEMERRKKIASEE